MWSVPSLAEHVEKNPVSIGPSVVNHTKHSWALWTTQFRQCMAFQTGVHGAKAASCASAFTCRLQALLLSKLRLFTHDVACVLAQQPYSIQVPASCACPHESPLSSYIHHMVMLLWSLSMAMKHCHAAAAWHDSLD